MVIEKTLAGIMKPFRVRPVLGIVPSGNIGVTKVIAGGLVTAQPIPLEKGAPLVFRRRLTHRQRIVEYNVSN